MLSQLKNMSDVDFRIMFSSDNSDFAKKLKKALYHMSNSDDIVRYILSRQSSLADKNDQLCYFESCIGKILLPRKSKCFDKLNYRVIDTKHSINKYYNVKEEQFYELYTHLADAIR